MNTVRKVVAGSTLAQIIELPKYLQDTQVEIIVMPIVQNRSHQPVTRRQLEALLCGSDTEALTGALATDIDLDIVQLRAERRAKYESVD